jgi:hypothetical protein
VFRCLAPALGLIVVLTPAAALAQVNIDQDKSPAQLYAGDCAACHKSVRGLANGRSVSALAGFLSEHYTASSREASAIAAYVLASGGAAAPARAQPEGERSRANAEQPRGREARRPIPPEGTPAGRKPEPERRAAAEPGQPGSARGPLPERHERGAARTRGRGKPLEAVSPPPAPPPPAPAPASAPEAKTAVVAPPPAQAAASGPQASPADTAEPKAAPAQSGEATPVPRDNIPD